MAVYVSREDRLANVYRRVEAMYRKGYSVDDIKRQTGLPRMDVLDVVQKIFAMDIRRNRAV